MQSGPHTAIHVAACPKQFMKLVVSILPSNGNSVWLYVLSILLSRIWSNFAHTLADVSSPPPPLAPRTYHLFSSYVSGLNGLAFVLILENFPYSD